MQSYRELNHTAKILNDSIPEIDPYAPNIKRLHVVLCVFYFGDWTEREAVAPPFRPNRQGGVWGRQGPPIARYVPYNYN